MHTTEALATPRILGIERAAADTNHSTSDTAISFFSQLLPSTGGAAATGCVSSQTQSRWDDAIATAESALTGVRHSRTERTGPDRTRTGPGPDQDCRLRRRDPV